MTAGVTHRIGVQAKGNDSQLKLANSSTKYVVKVVIEIDKVNHQHSY